jgi:F-type H+-transporting ATPase subunit delta
MSSESATSGTARDTVFDVDVERLARVYAKAVLDASGKNQGDVVDELKTLVTEVLDKFPKMDSVFASALISIDEKLAMLDRLFASRLSETTLNFLKVMTKHGRLGYLRNVVQSAVVLWRERNNHVQVELQLAHALDSALHQEVLASLGSALNIDPDVTTKINPDLIAGFIVRVGDKVYDASVRTRLEKTRHAVIERAVETLQREPSLFKQS